MPASVIVCDIETVPDLRGFAAANGLTGRLDDEARAEMGDKFPKLIYHSIVCIGALVAQRQDEHWAVSAVGAPHIGERSEKEIISAFVEPNRRPQPSAGYIQRGRLRLAGPALSRNGLRDCRAGAGGASVLQSIFRRRDRPLRCAVVLPLPQQGFAARALSRHGASRKARWHRRSGCREILSGRARSRSRLILRDRRRQHVPRLAALRAVSRTIDREWSASERSESE